MKNFNKIISIFKKKTIKIAINAGPGGFCLSEKAYRFLGIEWDGYGFAYGKHSLRTNKNLIKCIETLGKEARGNCADLKIVKIPQKIEYIIEECDGDEYVIEKNRMWR